jgi:hypothetical protein
MGRRTKRPWLCVASVAIVALVGERSPAQEKGESKDRRTITITEWPSLRRVLAIEDVRRLLELDEDEDLKIRLFIRGDRRGPRPREDDDEPPLEPDAPPWARDLRDQERRLKPVLGEKRYIRLREIQAQAGSLPGAFTRDEPSGRLGITTEQRNQARKEIRAAAEEMTDRLHAVPAGNAAAKAEVRSELYEKLDSALMNLLTDEQKEKWVGMTGEPADEALILKIRTLGGR